MYKHILICTDGSPLANKAAKAGIALAKALGAKVTAYSAVDDLQTLYSEDYAFNPKMIDRIGKAARIVGQKHVEKIGKMAKAVRVPLTSAVTLAPSADEGIIATAKKLKCDLIFMASHGRRGLSKLLMGSITQRVLANSKIPVVVYR